MRPGRHLLRMAGSPQWRLWTDSQKKGVKSLKSSLLFAQQAEAYVSSMQAGGGKARLLDAGGACPWVKALCQGIWTRLLRAWGQYQIKDLRVKEQTLEERFLHLYGGTAMLNRTLFFKEWKTNWKMLVLFAAI